MQNPDLTPAEEAAPAPAATPEAAPEAAPVNRNVERTKLAKAAKTDKAEKAAKSSSARKEHVHFVSAEEEISRFDIIVAGERISPFWDENREHLIWSVPTPLADRFALHEHVVKGRIVREK
jgi:hypothetical protein